MCKSSTREGELPRWKRGRGLGIVEQEKQKSWAASGFTYAMRMIRPASGVLCKRQRAILLNRDAEAADWPNEDGIAALM